jgi:hypothetical protein
VVKLPARGDIPPATFQNFVTELASTALACLGYLENPVHRSKVVELPRARHVIDLLMMLQVKTEGNLNEHEKAYLDTVVLDLQGKYLERDAGKAP